MSRGRKVIGHEVIALASDLAGEEVGEMDGLVIQFVRSIKGHIIMLPRIVILLELAQRSPPCARFVLHVRGVGCEGLICCSGLKLLFEVLRSDVTCKEVKQACV